MEFNNKIYKIGNWTNLGFSTASLICMIVGLFVAKLPLSICAGVFAFCALVSVVITQNAAVNVEAGLAIGSLVLSAFFAIASIFVAHIALGVVASVLVDLSLIGSAINLARLYWKPKAERVTKYQKKIENKFKKLDAQLAATKKHLEKEAALLKTSFNQTRYEYHVVKVDEKKTKLSNKLEKLARKNQVELNA